jgi:hypothetical protein
MKKIIFLCLLQWIYSNSIAQNVADTLAYKKKIWVRQLTILDLIKLPKSFFIPLLPTPHTRRITSSFIFYI